MTKPILTPYYGQENPFIFFPDFPALPDKVTGKLYTDGGHFIITPYLPAKPRKRYLNKPENIEAREQFEELYSQIVLHGVKRAQIRDYIRDGLRSLFPTENALNDFVEAELKRKRHNIAVRKKRFRRKAFLNVWTHFITITYSDKKFHDEDTFRRALRKCLANLHTRHNWRYMGVFERAPDTHRLHFHALLYVPVGQMLGTITEKRDYSTKSHRMQTTHENDFFAERFGRNDFSQITPEALRHGNTIPYLLKYINKTGERLIYSRGIRSEILTEIDKDDIVTKMRDFVTKYILFDDVIDWESDQIHIRRKCTPVQLTIGNLPAPMLC